MNNLRIMSLFSGIGAFEKALTRLGKSYELVNYSEIDKFASRAYSVIHDIDESKNLGDVALIQEQKLANFDLLTWGFPCQDISVAGKQKGIISGATRSGLYHEGFRILKEKTPKYSIIENVKALTFRKFKADFDSILNDIAALGYTNYWKVLNAKDFGVPQNRERVFIVSIRNDLNQCFEFPTGINSEIRLKDLLEDAVDEKYFLSPDVCSKLIVDNIKDVGRVGYRNEGREIECARTIMASEHKGMNNQGINVVKEVLPCISPGKPRTVQSGRRFKTDGEPMFTLTTQDRHGILQRIAVIGKGGQGSRVYNPTGLGTTITANSGGRGSNTGLYEIHEKIRRLTPLECFRLMGFDDEDYYKLKNIGISDTQLYKMAGNSIVVNVLEEILMKLIRPI